MVEGTSTVVSGKSGMDKINESMAKIGAMLGVQPSASSHSDDSKVECLIDRNQHDPVTTSPVAEPIVQMNSAEGHVISAPHEQEPEKTSAAGSMRSGGTGVTTRPTTPGKTKTAVGAAFASFAATLDNTVNRMNKNCRKLSETAHKTAVESGCGGVDNAELNNRDAEELLIRGTVTADGTAITQYVPIDKVERKPIPMWIKCSVGSLLAIVLSFTVASIIPGTMLNRMFTDINDDHLARNDPNVTVAFIGNSYLYVNDVPRAMECISKSKITQDSVLNTGAGLGSLLKQGNGMYELWQTTGALDFWGGWDFKAMMVEYDIEVDGDYSLYDFGMCTVPQLLEGHDNYLSYRNQNGIYFDVGTNPCFEDTYYMTIISHKYDKEPAYYDYIVLNDQTRRMASEDGRQDTIDALTQAYASLIKTSRAIPIIVDTHAYIFDAQAQINQQYYQQLYGGTYAAEEGDDGLNEEDFDDVDNDQTLEEAEEIIDISTDIPLFQAAIYEGLYEYVDALKYYLPARQHPKIAPIGLTYLAIYDDNKSMYAKLFAQDGIHASQHGTYLFACVLYCTMYGHLPLSPHDDFDIRSIFFKSRSMFGSTATPSMSDVSYLRYWARKVTVDGFIPRSMVMPGSVSAEEQAVERGYNQTYCDEVAADENVVNCIDRNAGRK